MNKVLLEICVPAIDECFDIFAPVDVPIQELTVLISNGVEEITNGQYVASGSEQLCLKTPAGLLNPMLTLQDYGISNGMQLYFV